MTRSTPSAFGLTGKVCVVTGGGGGIGRSVALAFAEEGGRVAVLDRDPANSAETVRQIRELGGAGIAIDCDVTDAASVEAAHATAISAFGAVDILVNCAAIQRRGPLETLPVEEWDAALDVNLRGYFLCAQIFGRTMLSQGAGAMVHVSSVQSLYPSPNAGSYSPAKSAVVMLSRQLALEWGPCGVRSNAVLPAWVVTPLSAARYATPGFTEARSAMVPLRRIGRPEDTAEAVLFLASPRASYISGTELLVDGGLTCNLMGSIKLD